MANRGRLIAGRILQDAYSTNMGPRGFRRALPFMRTAILGKFTEAAVVGQLREALTAHKIHPAVIEDWCHEPRRRMHVRKRGPHGDIGQAKRAKARQAQRDGRKQNRIRNAAAKLKGAGMRLASALGRAVNLKRSAGRKQ